MEEREKQAEEFLKKVPILDHRGQYPYSQGINQERNLDDQATTPKVVIKSPMREERVTTPRERGDRGKPIGAPPHIQVKTKYEVEMDGRRIGSTEKKGQGTHRWTHPSQPPPPPLTGGGAGGHRGGGGGGGDDGGPDDSDDGSDDDEDESEETDSETSSTQEVPQEELRGQRVFRRRINGRGCGYS